MSARHYGFPEEGFEKDSHSFLFSGFMLDKAYCVVTLDEGGKWYRNNRTCSTIEAVCLMGKSGKLAAETIKSMLLFTAALWMKLLHLDPAMNNVDQKYLLQKAREKTDNGACRAAYKILAPLIIAKCPEALYLYSTFRLIRKETDEEFEQRSLGILNEAANLGSPEALYRLGAYYDVGDVVDKNVEKASQLFKLAAESGHAKSKAFHGLDLFYGLNGIPQDQALGLEFLRQAVDDNVEGAAYSLEKIKDKMAQSDSPA